MPRLSPATQAARREHILDAAERCFARSGFHRTTMHDICKEAGISAGALYVYFPSKEALIAGISERDRAEFARRLAVLAEAPDFMHALSKLGEQYFLEEPAHKRLMCVEIGVESTRNLQVGEIYRGVDRFVLAGFERLFQRLKDEGRIDPSLDIKTLARVFITIGDGLFWRRAVDPDFDAKTVLPAVVQLIGTLLNVKPATRASGNPQSKAEATS
ncbi:MAG TPA: TetR/AcrR family transcriptional regulator [Hyphomicrobiaceae bacterium]|nr:TetR/AcrR family transcriptional regulator [Hyphomicrobiaceae bacterium]